MISQWRVALWLRLLSDLSSDHDDSTNKRRLGNPFSRSSEGGNPTSNKTWLTRFLIFLTVVIIFYLLFIYGGATHIDIKCIKCNGGDLKVETLKNGEKQLKTVESITEGGAYSEKLGIGTGEQVYRITTYDNSNKKISFNISKSLVSDKWVYKVPGSNCSYSKSANCTCDKEKCCCCCKDCAKECKCCGEAGSCQCNGESKCACCQFMNLVDYAILHPLDPNRVTPASLFFSLLPSLLYLGFFIFMARSAVKGQSMGIYGQGGIFNIGNSLSKTAKSTITFKDVAGIEEEKDELKEIVDYLKHPSKYNAMGARTPKGVILYGPPGTGKTLLAKAVSGEANVPFIEVAGSSFDDMFVGVGAKRVRELFTKAKKLAPCIIFIDEIDAVAGKRGNKYMGGGINDQTINQLLSEMDGFNTMTGIVIMAATNRLDSIDDAILRPGRFDRHIQVNLPDINERIEILKVHARNKNISSSVKLENIARKTPGFSGAQLENVLNEATLLAVREDKKVIDSKHIDEAIDRVIAGPAKKNRKISFNEKRQIAYHEAGHAIAGLYSKEGEVVEKITIIPRGKAGGYMLSTPEKQESFIKRKDELLSTVLTTLAGRAAEEIFFGEDKVSSGASNDLFKVTNLVRSMITKLGMSKNLGLIQYEPSEGIENPYRAYYSEKYSEAIDREMKEIITEQYEKAKQIILDNRKEFLLIVETLLLIETIDRTQIQYIHEHKKLPKEAIDMKEKLIQEGKEVNNV